MPHRKYIEHGARNYSEKTSFSAFPVKATKIRAVGTGRARGATAPLLLRKYCQKCLKIGLLLQISVFYPPLLVLPPYSQASLNSPEHGTSTFSVGTSDWLFRVNETSGILFFFKKTKANIKAFIL